MRAAAISTGVVILGVIVLSGCGSSAPPKPAGQPAATSTPPPPPVPVQPPVVSAPALGSPPANATTGQPPVAFPTVPPVAQPPAVAPPAASPPVAVNPAPAIPAPPGGPRVNIADAGKKDFGGPAIVKPITVPIQALFSARSRTKWIEIQSALNLYKAEHEGGPKTEKEFFDGVIKANQIDLPKLQPGERYVFDVEKQELLVESPGP